MENTIEAIATNKLILIFATEKEFISIIFKTAGPTNIPAIK